MDITWEIALDLMRRSLYDTSDPVDAGFASADWNHVFTFLREHAVIPFAWHAIRKTPAYSRAVPAEIQARMRSIVLNGVFANECLMEAQDGIIRLFGENGIPCAVLKGSSVAANYPRPELRALGDIDLLVRPDALDVARDLLIKEGYALEKREKAHDFHISFRKNNVLVELHFAVSHIPDAKRAECVDELMEDALDGVLWRPAEPYVFPTLSPAHQAVSLLLHMERHWVDEGIGLRQLMDWHTFVHSNDEKTWREIMAALERCRLSRLAAVFTAVCVSYLGLEKCAWCPAEGLSGDMMRDILESGHFGSRMKAGWAIRMFYDKDRKCDASFIFGTIRGMSRNIQSKYPVCANIPVLLVFFWLYLPLRYWVRRLRGLRAKRSCGRMMVIAAARKKIYQALN